MYNSFLSLPFLSLRYSYLSCTFPPGEKNLIILKIKNMKRLLVPLAAAMLLIACNNEKTESTEEKMDDKRMSENISYPYTAEYSHDFKMGDPNHSKMVLDFFKIWEENRLDDMKTMLIDSVWIEFADGSKFNTISDSIVTMAKQFRMNYSKIEIKVDGWMPIHTNDTKDDWVLVWSKDITTDTQGKVDSIRSHSYWQIKNNKISGWSEFSQKLTPPPPQKK